MDNVTLFSVKSLVTFHSNQTGKVRRHENSVTLLMESTENMDCSSQNKGKR